MKSLFDVLKGTILGVDGEGSAKRIAAMHFLLLITIIDFAYLYWCDVIVIRAKPGIIPSVIDTNVMDQFTHVHDSHTLSLWLLLGLATLEMIFQIVKLIKGEKLSNNSNV